MSAPEDLRARTKKYALRLIRLYRALPQKDAVADVLGRQLPRSATSVAAHYREARRIAIFVTITRNVKIRRRRSV